MESLNAIAKSKGLMFGAAAAGPTLTDASLAALYQQHCGIITTDIALKWSTVRPTSNMTPDWTQADALLSWAETNNIKVKGHTLVWNEFNPSWLWTDSSTGPSYGSLTSPVTVDQAKSYFDQHIDETISRYAGRIHYWDVVNEPIELSHGRSDGMRAKTWMTVWGPKYVERALVRAGRADPSAKLFINEANLERFQYETNRVQFLNLIDRVLDAGAPLHGVGLEGHLIMWALATHEGLMWLLSELNKRKLEVHLSELDVQHAGNSGAALPAGTAPAVIDAAVANFVRPVLADILSFPNVKAIITWELTDQYSWAYSWAPRPLPFDSTYQPKPFATEILNAFKNCTIR